MVKCPKCKTENEKIRVNYVGEDSNDGVDHFFECAACGLEYETWYSRGSDGYTLSWDGKTEFVRGSDERPARSTKPCASGKFTSPLEKRRNFTPWKHTFLSLPPEKSKDFDLPRAFSYWVAVGLMVSFALTILDPVNLPLAEALAGSALTTIVILAIGFILRSDGVFGCGTIAAVVLLVVAISRFIWVDWPTFAFWGLIWVASLVLTTLFVSRLTVPISLLLMVGLALGAWRWYQFTPPQLVLFNALDRSVLVSVNGKEELKLNPSGFLQRALAEPVELIARLEDGTVIESVGIKPQKGLFPPHTLYNVKGRGVLNLSGSKGTESYSRRLALKVETFAARGIDVIFPGQSEPSRSHWVKLVVVETP